MAISELGQHIPSVHLGSRISRRSALIGGASAAIAGVLVAGGYELRSQGQNEIEGLKALIPEGTVDVFQSGHTLYGFENTLSQPARKRMREVIEATYPKLKNIYGTEPNDSAGREGILTVVRLRNPNDTANSDIAFSEPFFGAPRHDISIDENAPDGILVHELGHTFWGVNHLRIAKNSAYLPLNEGFSDQAAKILGYESKDNANLKKAFNMSSLNYEIYNKAKIASDGMSIRGLAGIRRMLAAQALDEILQIDPGYISRLRKPYTDLLMSRMRQTEFPSEEVRALIDQSFNGDMDEIRRRHAILRPAQTGRFVIIGNSFDTQLQSEELYAFSMQRDTPSEEKTVPDVMNISMEINGKSIKNWTGRSPLGVEHLVSMDFLKANYPNQVVTLKAESNFDSDEISFNIPKVA